MSTTMPLSGIPAQIESLQVVIEQVNEPLDWLVVAHNDPRMLKSLSRAMHGKSAAILEVSQDTWDFSAGPLSDTIRWSLEQGRVRNILIVGHSMASGSSCRISLVGETAGKADNATVSDSYARLLEGVQRNNERNRTAQTNFASHVLRVMRLVETTPLQSSENGAVCGLFYRADCDLFLKYNPDSNEFQTLAG